MHNNSIRYIIFDLSEVLIHGVVAFEENIARELGIDGESSWSAFGGAHLHALLRGNMTEDEYLTHVLAKNGWTFAPGHLKMLLRQNFEVVVPGMIEIARELSHSYKLALLSDHAREWVAHIRTAHAFLENLFTCQVYSYEIGSTKQEARTFQTLLGMLSAEPQQCLFIDDNARNIEIARGVGIDGIRFLNAEQLRRDLYKRGLIRL